MKTAFLILFSLLSLAGFSQRVDLDKYNFNASYIELPKMVIDTSYKTFFVEIDASSALEKELGNLDPAEIVYIDGWKKLDGTGHVKIFARLEDVFIENIEVKERIEVLKDKDGKETGKKTHYYVQLTYTFAAECKVTDYKENPLLNWNLASRDNRQTYNTKEFSNFVDATLYIKFRGLDFNKEIAKRAVQNAMYNVNNELNYSLGYSARTVTDFLWILDSRKHPEYDAHRKAWLSFKQAMFQMDAEQPLDEIRQSLTSVISYFESIKKKYSSNNKADRKMRYASHFNLAKIHYYLDNPDAAMREAGELMMNEYDEKDGKRLEVAASQLKQLLKQNKFTSRHFSLQTEKYAAPPVVTARD